MTDLLLSTGCYPRVMKYDLNDVILRALTHNVAGIEASFLTTDELFNFSPDDIIVSRLSNTYNTLHAPTKNIKYSNNAESIIVLDKIKYMYKVLNCKNIVFHYETLSDVDFLSTYLSGFNLSVENSNNSNPVFSAGSDIEAFLEKNSSFSLTLDVCHALEFSKEYLRQLTNKFSDKIAEVHWSYSGHKLNHDSASSIISDIKFGLYIVKKLDKKTVLEVDLRPNLENRNVISSEIELLKNGL
ncbi:Uncharacterised protein [Candidatus Tiddalikarchaeum anstoanum]|nr:Uncharacterised protein [Candidatus Tiddalikarchaeum anstoanum]